MLSPLSSGGRLCVPPPPYNRAYRKTFSEPGNVVQLRRRQTITLSILSLLETRVLGVLIEKERTVPDSYPLTLNAVMSGSNQKSSRDPIMNAAETEVQAAI